MDTVLFDRGYEVQSLSSVQRNKIQGILEIITFGLIVGTSALVYLSMSSRNERIPQRIQKGFIHLSELEINENSDIDKNSDRETILNYKGKSYLFKEDEAGRPVAIPYQIKLPEINESK